MFRAPCAHRQETKIVLYSLWYHQTEKSEWSKITKIIKIIKIQFYKYEHMVVHFMCEFLVLLIVNMLWHVEVMFNQLLKTYRKGTMSIYIYVC